MAVNAASSDEACCFATVSATISSAWHLCSCLGPCRCPVLVLVVIVCDVVFIGVLVVVVAALFNSGCTCMMPKQAVFCKLNLFCKN